MLRQPLKVLRRVRVLHRQPALSSRRAWAPRPAAALQLRSLAPLFSPRLLALVQRTLLASRLLPVWVQQAAQALLPASVPRPRRARLRPQALDRKMVSVQPWRRRLDRPREQALQLRSELRQLHLPGQPQGQARLLPSSFQLPRERRLGPAQLPVWEHLWRRLQVPHRELVRPLPRLRAKVLQRGQVLQLVSEPRSSPRSDPPPEQAPPSRQPGLLVRLLAKAPRMGLERLWRPVQLPQLEQVRLLLSEQRSLQRPPRPQGQAQRALLAPRRLPVAATLQAPARPPLRLLGRVQLQALALSMAWGRRSPWLRVPLQALVQLQRRRPVRVLPPELEQSAVLEHRLLHRLLHPQASVLGTLSALRSHRARPQLQAPVQPPHRPFKFLPGRVPPPVLARPVASEQPWRVPQLPRLGLARQMPKRPDKANLPAQVQAMLSVRPLLVRRPRRQASVRAMPLDRPRQALRLLRLVSVLQLATPQLWMSVQVPRLGRVQPVLLAQLSLPGSRQRRELAQRAASAVRSLPLRARQLARVLRVQPAQRQRMFRRICTTASN